MNALEFIEAIEEGEVTRVTEALRNDPGLINTLDGLGNTVLHTACWQNLPELVELFVRSGCDVNARGDMQRTPLHYAVHCGGHCTPEIISILLNAGANKSSADQAGHTPLEWAHIEMFGYEELPEVERLLTYS